MKMQELDEARILIDEILNELKETMEHVESGDVTIDAVKVGASIAIYSIAKGLCERHLAENKTPHGVLEEVVNACANGDTHKACMLWGIIDSKHGGLEAFFE